MRLQGTVDRAVEAGERMKERERGNEVTDPHAPSLPDKEVRIVSNVSDTCNAHLLLALLMEIYPLPRSND